ncbi:MAG TPA: superoxide dismutase family protein [Kofleriaceae bacterium]|nr:superoxide dismutase family protein [Kofleriaceae bacterium]
MKNLAAFLGLALMFGAGCKKDEEKAPAEGPKPAPAPTDTEPKETAPAVPTQLRMIAELEPKSGSEVKGTIWFTQGKNGVTIEASVQGLTPGLHGFHIHETGDCSAEDGSSAGGHFKVGDQPHGKPDGDAHHAGDLGNLAARADGKAEKSFGSTAISLEPGPTFIGDRAVIVHADQDDMKTQPTGNAGGRVACGLIKLDTSEKK